MNVFLVVFFNALILVTWVYLLYQVYTVDPEVQSQWDNAAPPWADSYRSMILSVKITAFLNGTLVLLTIISAMYRGFTGGRR
jgi:hypothetical protein